MPADYHSPHEWDGTPYPFNGMGGFIHSGPFETEDEAYTSLSDSIYVDPETGMEYWKE